MNKAYKYTLFTVFLSLVFAFGSMVGMNFILEAREKQMLTENGRVVVEAPVWAWQKEEDREERENLGNSDQENYILTMEQVAEAIGSWNSRTGETVHNPVVGQISMAEAIQKGEMWLSDMGIEANEQESDVHFVNATLGVPKQNELSGQLEPYYSFWTVQFSGEVVNAILYINAVTGKILGAEVSLYRNLPDKLPVEKLSLFVELAGLQESDTETVFDPDGTSAFLEMADSRLCAEMEFQRRQNGYFDLTQYGQDSMGANPDLYYNEYAVITYKLAVMGE